DRRATVRIHHRELVVPCGKTADIGKSRSEAVGSVPVEGMLWCSTGDIHVNAAFIAFATDRETTTCIGYRKVDDELFRLDQGDAVLRRASVHVRCGQKVLAGNKTGQ